MAIRKSTRTPKPKTRSISFFKRLRSFRLKSPRYFSESYNELKKVVWPTRKESRNLTVAVFVFSAIFLLIVVLADYVFQLIAERLY